MSALVPINLYFHSNKREWRARYMDNGVKKAKHFSCKRYRENRSFFLASLFMRALSEYHEVPSDEFIAYWAGCTETFTAFGNTSKDVSRSKANSEDSTALKATSLRHRHSSKDLGFKTEASEAQSYNGLANSLAEYKLVKDSRNDSGRSSMCLLRNDSSGDLISETSRDDSEASSDVGNQLKEEANDSQMPEDARIKNSPFYDGDFSVFVQRQKLLYRVIEDLQSSVFVSKPSIDFVPKINLESIEQDYILLDPKLLSSGRVLQPTSRQSRKRPSEEIPAPLKRTCSQGSDRHGIRQQEYTLESTLKKCSEGSTKDILQKSVHLQKLVNLLGGADPAEIYATEVVDGIQKVKSICERNCCSFGADSFYEPSLRHPVDSIHDPCCGTIHHMEKDLVTDNTLYSAKNSFMMPKNITSYMTAAKPKENANNESDDEHGDTFHGTRMSNSKLAHFVESLCGVNFEETIIKDSLEQNAKECCDLRSLIQVSRAEKEANHTTEEGSLQQVSGEFYTNSANHIAYIEPLETTPVTYYNNRILPNDAMDFYFNANACDYTKSNLVRMEGGGPLDISPDTFTNFDNRRQNMSHYLEAIAELEERIRDVQERSERMQRALHYYSQQERVEGTNDLQEMLNLETLLFVSDTLMETKRRLHNELRRKVQDELDMINHILPEPLADSLTRILYPSVKW